jgi:hypothetical protein
MKATQIRLQDVDGKVYRWTISREPRAINCNLGSSKVVSGWNFTDHAGYVRFAEGNWQDLVARFHAVAANHGLALMSELS